MAGHSKWKQIKHKKALSDAKRGALFSKLAKEITVAARSGGANPEGNSRLRGAILRAQDAGVPKDNIARAMERATGPGEGAALSEFLYEAVGPGGAAILIEGITDNKNRTGAELRHILAEAGARMADPGSLLWNFEKIGTVAVSPADNRSKTADELELLLIDAGAKDIVKNEEFWTAHTDFADQEALRSRLEAAGIKTRETAHDYKTRNPLTLLPEEREKLENLLDQISEHDDVQEVYTNDYSRH